MKCVIDQKRESDTPVCPACRRGLADDLRALVDAYAMLVVVEELDGANDPVSQTLPAGTVRSGVRDAPVTGSREAPVPPSLDVVDLLLPASQGSRVPHARAVLGLGDPSGLWEADDQTGYLSVATELDTWVRDWITYSWCPGDHLPVPTVVTLAGWLSNRLEVACDRHDSIDEFASDIHRMLRTCQRHAGDAPVRPEVLEGVPCATPNCDGILLHRPGDDYWAECALCNRLWTEDEYRQWVALVAAQTRRPAA